MNEIQSCIPFLHRVGCHKAHTMDFEDPGSEEDIWYLLHFVCELFDKGFKEKINDIAPKKNLSTLCNAQMREICAFCEESENNRDPHVDVSFFSRCCCLSCENQCSVINPSGCYVFFFGSV